MELSLNEKRLLKALEQEKSADPDTLAARMGATRDQVVQYAMLLSDRGMARIEKTVEMIRSLTAEGTLYAREGLPERQLLKGIEGKVPMAELTKHPLSRIGIGQMRKKGWVSIRDGMVERTGKDAPGPDELALRDLSLGGEGARELIKRGLATEEETVSYRIAITPEGEQAAGKGLDLSEEVGTLSREQIISGEWKNLNLRRYDVTKLPKKAYPGKVHPYQRIIGEMREILLDMGFEELYGDIVQQSFWNFDALFQPQDHPAR
ncbi:MAG: phenylalanine--tRNA ligase subunit alpha, partial [Methanolinea sp.]|nr:phenylalanine--tRNA ligase subunit alpha [Methanolinea sp.]